MPDTVRTAKQNKALTDNYVFAKNTHRKNNILILNTYIVR